MSAASVSSEMSCEGLPGPAQLHLQNIASAIDQVAPIPGSVVYLHSTDLGNRLHGLLPVVFSAIDAVTNLHTAQINFAKTSAAALSFVEFVIRSFPFPVIEIKTRNETPFGNDHNGCSHRNFKVLVRERGLLHSFINDPANELVFSVVSKEVFGYLSDTLSFSGSTRELQNALHKFLFFHNNCRLVPWLDGKTPLEKLRTFERYQDVRSFDELDGHQAASTSVAATSVEPQTYSRSSAASRTEARRNSRQRRSS